MSCQRSKKRNHPSSVLLTSKLQSTTNQVPIKNASTTLPGKQPVKIQLRICILICNRFNRANSCKISRMTREMCRIFNVESSRVKHKTGIRGRHTRLPIMYSSLKTQLSADRETLKMCQTESTITTRIFRWVEVISKINSSSWKLVRPFLSNRQVV